jgi:exodeoxyribonuclease VII large subunit
LEQLNLSIGTGPQVFSVTALTAGIARLLSGHYDDVRVAGEISGVKISGNGNAWFTLKDEGAAIRCVIWKSALRMMKFKPQDGLAATARGAVDVWAERGEYQLIVGGLEPQGYGALQLAFEHLKRKLEAEGLFSPERKRPLPAYPRRIGIVTSPAGAAVQDILSVLARRWPGLHIRLYPTPVQGEGAAEGIAEGIGYFSRSGWAEVVIAGRGGGPPEDLWAFNEERVARAIAECSVPVVSAVGHETDFTIADFVADLRAPTPSAAAELVVRDAREVEAALAGAARRAERSVRLRIAESRRMLHERGIDKAHRLLERRIGRAQQRLEELDGAVRESGRYAIERHRRGLHEREVRLREHDPRVRLARAAAAVAGLERRAARRIEARLAAARRIADPLAARLDALSPLRILERGYSIVQTGDGRIVRRWRDAPPGAGIRIRLHQGRLAARVEESGPESGDG